MVGAIDLFEADHSLLGRPVQRQVDMRVLRALETNAPPKNWEEESTKAKARAAERFGA
jgi:hypothetical protein